VASWFETREDALLTMRLFFCVNVRVGIAQNILLHLSHGAGASASRRI
jgi:hypothetical protein